MLALAGALLLGVGIQVDGQWSTVNSQQSTVDDQQSTVDRRPLTTVPAPWLQGDPADSIYRVAREALNKGRYREALDAFRSLERKFPKSGYVADGLYWQAFALYRLGGRANLQQATERLARQASAYDKAATRGDAEALRVRINTELAQLGDVEATEDLVRRADRLAVPPTPPSAPRAPVAPRVAGAVFGAPRADSDCGEDGDVKVMAMQGLLRNNPERAMPILKELMARRDSASLCLRRHALFLLATSNDQAASDMLINAAMSDPDKEVRESAVFWLSRTSDERAVPILDSVLRSSTDPDVQQAAIFALGTKRSDQARAALRSYVTKPGISPDLANAALFQVARDPRTTSAELKQFYANARSTEQKQQVLVAMMTRGDKDLAWLKQIVSDRNEDAELRQQALMTLIQGDVPTADLLKLFDAVQDDREMQGMMVLLMSRRPNDPAITDRLISIVKTSKDRELREQAMFWLGQSKDPRATALLEEILRQ
jgi:HEAT repeat protein